MNTLTGHGIILAIIAGHVSDPLAQGIVWALAAAMGALGVFVEYRDRSQTR